MLRMWLEPAEAAALLKQEGEFGIFFPAGEALSVCMHREHVLLDFQGTCLVWEGEV